MNGTQKMKTTFKIKATENGKTLKNKYGEDDLKIEDNIKKVNKVFGGHPVPDTSLLRTCADALTEGAILGGSLKMKVCCKFLITSIDAHHKK